MLTTSHLFLANAATSIDRALVLIIACLIILFSTVCAQSGSGLERDPLASHHMTARLTLFVGQAEVVRYSREPGTVIIGDPAIVVASLAAYNIIVLTGLKAGVTNLIVLDDSGTQIDRTSLRVVVPGETVILRRGIEREVFRCDPLCHPTNELGIGPAELSPHRVVGGFESDDAAGIAAPMDR